MVNKTHGVTSDTFKRFIIDAGAVYLNYGKDNQRILGATRGGNQFVVETEYRTMPVDGAGERKIKGNRRIINTEVRVVGNLIEMTAENLSQAIPGSTVETPTEETYKKITRARDVQDEDFIENVALVGKVHQTGENFVGIVYSALSDGPFELQTEDDDEAGLEVTFSGHFDPDDLDQEPWEIRHPE